MSQFEDQQSISFLLARMLAFCHELIDERDALLRLIAGCPCCNAKGTAGANSVSLSWPETTGPVSSAADGSIPP